MCYMQSPHDSSDILLKLIWKDQFMTRWDSMQKKYMYHAELRDNLENWLNDISLVEYFLLQQASKGQYRLVNVPKIW
jgi:hypothetical protein